MKKPSLMHITAIVMVGVCLYSIITDLGALLYASRLSRTYAKNFVSIFIMVWIGISVLGIITGIGLYFYKKWSYRLAMVIAVIFFLQAGSSLQTTFLLGHIGNIKITIASIFMAMFAIWCLYYLNRSDVKEKFIKAKTFGDNTASNIILTRPKSINITAILLIVYCGTQSILYFIISTKMALSVGIGNIYLVIIFFFITPIMGLTAGIGLLRTKKWSREFVLMYSGTTIVLHGCAAFSIPFGSWFVFFFLVFYLLSLPVWSLYYFTRPRIKAYMLQNKVSISF